MDSFDDYLSSTAPLLRLLGKKPPHEEEVRKAQGIIAAIPAGLEPIGVAEHLANLEDYNADQELYKAEWRVRANPLIVQFLVDTNTVPEGDQTPWCAAFVNFCLVRAGRRGTKSASSGSFRCAGRAATSPKPGDIAVFAKTGYDEPCSGKGHAAFFVSQTASHVVVLGGNQGNQIQTSKYLRNGDPRFLSVRDLGSIP